MREDLGPKPKRMRGKRDGEVWVLVAMQKGSGGRRCERAHKGDLRAKREVEVSHKV